MHLKRTIPNPLEPVDNFYFGILPLFSAQGNRNSFPETSSAFISPKIVPR